MTRYRCTRCKYVYDPNRGDPAAGIAEGTPFAALPAGWTCPVSGAAKAEFVVEDGEARKADGKADAPKKSPPPKNSEPAKNIEPARPQSQSQAQAQRAWTVGSLKNLEKKTGS